MLLVQRFANKTEGEVQGQRHSGGQKWDYVQGHPRIPQQDI